MNNGKYIENEKLAGFFAIWFLNQIYQIALSPVCLYIANLPLFYFFIENEKSF